MKRNRIIVAGHACLDITPKFPEINKSSKLSEILSPGKLIQMNGVDINPGGAVSNTGIAMKTLGGDVLLAAKIGNDDFGNILSGIYEKHGITEGIIKCQGERTSYSCVVAVPGSDRIFLHDPGANDSFSFEDIKGLDLTDVKLFHFGYPPIMKRMYANNGSELIEIFKYIKSKGIVTSLDMTFVDEHSEAGKTDWEELLKGLLPFVDLFLPSIEETCWMVDRERYVKWNKRVNNDDICMQLTPDEVKPIADKIMNMGTKVLLLKCGAPGLYYKTKNSEELLEIAKIIPMDVNLWANKEGFEKSYKPEKVLSGTGAGDTTIAAFLTSMLLGKSLERSLQIATAEGASCVEAYGAIEGIRSIEKLEEMIDAGWDKNQFI